jgi:hypothetical protein
VRRNFREFFESLSLASQLRIPLAGLHDNQRGDMG